MQISHIDLGPRPLFLAPMEDITDPSFRYLCKKSGADVMFTEFISSDGLIRNGAKSVKKLEIFDYERPMGIQLYGHLTASMVEATRRAAESAPDLIDINFGCPVRKIAARGAGAGMLANIPLMMEMTRAIVDASPVPVTVKTRLGLDEQHKPIVEVAEMLQDQGISAITIHGRTRAQMYKGKADWTLIGEVKRNPRMHIPVIGNGDITHPAEAKEAFDRYGVDGIMIGRAAVGRPWLFGHTRHFLDSGELLPDPSVEEKVELAKLHFSKSLACKSAPVGVYEMRRHFSSYFRGLPHFREMRLKLLTSLDIEEIFSILDRISETYGHHRPEVNGSFWDR
ncbi:MAG TPA: tRNA dihydrouridine synthase DusB [Bacteroides sp.]|nr:tRNA dihydrouridine synthase DusB [Bacteroides sp.]